jgi:hypothetical protein
MSEQETDYKNAVVLCVLAAEMLAVLPLPDLLRAIDHADTVGPILDPTLWIKKNKAMAEDADLFKAALALRNYGCRIRGIGHSMRPTGTDSKQPAKG